MNPVRRRIVRNRFPALAAAGLLLLGFGPCHRGWGEEVAAPADVPQTGYRWQDSPGTIALLNGDTVLWQFNHGPQQDVPFFQPVSTPTGRVLTWNSPPDHVWHHGLWFCWKFINGVNYWEPNQQTGKPDGRTTWSDVRFETRDDYSASISLDLQYAAAADDSPVLREHREIEISAPGEESLRFDWHLSFTAEREAVLDRTPPKDQSWGGYAGLSVRYAKDLTQRSAIGPDGPLTFDGGNRHRSHGAAVDYAGEIRGGPVGVALMDHPDNPRHPTPWYLIRSPQMGYTNAALLNDEPMTLDAGQTLDLRYRVVVHNGRWDAARLREAYRGYAAPVIPSSDD